MKKNVYSKNIPHFAGNHGLFEEENFPKFMESWKSAELVHRCNDIYGSYLSLVYHIEPEGATLFYRKSTTVEGNVVNIVLYGLKNELGEIEKKLLGNREIFLKARKQ